MIDQKQVEIGDTTYTIESLPTTKALTVLARLSQMVGGVADGVMDWPSASNPEERAQQAKESLHFGRMVKGVLAQINPEETPQFVKGLIKDSLVPQRDWGKDQFDQWYEGQFSRALGQQLELLQAIFEWNYGPVFDWLKKEVEATLMGRMETAEGQSTNAGGSPQPPSTS